MKLSAIYTDENDLDCRKLISKICLKNDEISSLFFNDFGTVIVLVQVLPNITSLSTALILIFFMKIWSLV